MGAGSKIKLAICEVLQFAAFCVPLFIVLQRFAFILSRAKSLVQPSGGDFLTTYWLIVASSVAYVTTVALMVWLPMKYMVFMKKKSLVGQKKWRPVALAYVLLSTLPTFAFLIASSEVQIRNDIRLDTFAELPVSLVLFSLICIDIVERLRHCRLTGRAIELNQDADIPTLNHVQSVMPIASTFTGPSPSVTTATPQNRAGTANGDISRSSGNAAVTGLTGRELAANQAMPAVSSNTTIPAIPSIGPMQVLPVSDQGQPYGVSGISPHTGLPLRNVPFVPAHTGPLHFLLASDVRAEDFADSFIFWLDTAEMLRVTSHTPVYFSGWALPIYLLSFLSMLRVALMPHTPLLSPMGVALQDLPFLFLRIALLSLFGFVTPVLFVLKNILVCLAYIYFNFMTKLKVFNTERMF